MTGFDSKRRIALDRLDDDDIQVYAKPSSKRPIEADYNSHSSYTRALELFCDTLAQPPLPVQPVQEPVATVTSESGNPDVKMSWWHEPALTVGTKLYTAPPQRPWVELTNEEIEAIEEKALTKQWAIRMALTAVKEKNT